MVDKELLTEIKRRLTAHYGARLKGVLLFGSEARGESDEHSDVDLMVLLSGPVDTGREIRAITNEVYRSQIEHGFFRPVEVIPVDVEDYNQVTIGLYRNVKEEGIAL